MAIDYEAEYNNRARVPEHPSIFEAWMRDAEAFRAKARGEIDLAYGDGPRQKLDLFTPPDCPDGAPLVLFIHGGYWQSLDKSAFSHLAQGVLAQGLPAALPSYTLCPEATVGDIIAEMRQCAAFLYRKTGRRIIATGHSAGGHLSAALLATIWAEIGDDLPSDLVPAALAISGVFDLRPLIHTSINDALKLDNGDAARVSPFLWHPPVDGILHLAVGGAESHEFIRQSKDMAAEWGSKGVHTSYHETEFANHFTVIDDLAETDSALTLEISALARRISAD